jgi:hypothetical protein
MLSNLCLWSTCPLPYNFVTENNEGECFKKKSSQKQHVIVKLPRTLKYSKCIEELGKDFSKGNTDGLLATT